ncbi:MAG TPA: hypothetical protein VFY16_11840 [Gemmatimonadaceae bacterium]|nr:hypothetical protein [Gemmatimonadaceae bacterium]
MRLRPSSPRLPATIAALALGALSACTGGGDAPRGAARTSVACPDPSNVAVRVAVEEFVGRPSPKPLRFLAPTSDPLPDEAMRALQNKGPTYLFPPESSAQAPVRAKLDEVGAWPTLLVHFHGVREEEGGVVVTLSGRYVGGAEEGREVPRTEVRLTCDASGWKATESTAQKLS